MRKFNLIMRYGGTGSTQVDFTSLSELWLGSSFEFVVFPSSVSVSLARGSWGDVGWVCLVTGKGSMGIWALLVDPPFQKGLVKWIGQSTDREEGFLTYEEMDLWWKGLEQSLIPCEQSWVVVALLFRWKTPPRETCALVSIMDVCVSCEVRHPLNLSI